MNSDRLPFPETLSTRLSRGIIGQLSSKHLTVRHRTTRDPGFGLVVRVRFEDACFAKVGELETAAGPEDVFRFDVTVVPNISQ